MSDVSQCAWGTCMDECGSACVSAEVVRMATQSFFGGCRWQPLSGTTLAWGNPIPMGDTTSCTCNDMHPAGEHHGREGACRETDDYENPLEHYDLHN
jgi:hypothetical protein